MRTSLSIRAYLAVIALGVFVLGVLAAALPHDPYIRWQSLRGTMFERTGYLYERLNFDSAPVDVVFIGSSRTGVGVNAPLLQRDLAARGLDLNVLNMSLPASGMDIRVTEAREALRAHPEVRLLVISVVEAFPRDGHQAFAELATSGEILGSEWIINRRLPAAILRLPMRQMKLAAATGLPDAFGYRAHFDPARYPGTTIGDQAMPGWQPQQPAHPLGSPEHARDLAAESALRKREINPPLLPESLAWAEFGVSRSAIEEIIDLARSNDTEIAFMFLPFFDGYAAPLEKTWLEERGPLWRAEWLRHEPENYRDAAHTSPLVRPRLNAWVADRVVEVLAEAPSPAAARE